MRDEWVDGVELVLRITAIGIGQATCCTSRGNFTVAGHLLIDTTRTTMTVVGITSSRPGYLFVSGMANCSGDSNVDDNSSPKVDTQPGYGSPEPPEGPNGISTRSRITASFHDR